MGLLSFIPIIGDIIDGATDIIKEVVTDKDKANEIEAKLKTLALATEVKVKEMEHKEKMGQIEINKVSAASNDAFVRRARPATLWICNIALAYNFVMHPMAEWALTIWAPTIKAPPLLGVEYLMVVLGGLLGFGGYRSLEYIKGVIKK